MAGGFLGPSEGSSVATLEDIGDEYFDDLFSYSLLQEAARDPYGKIVSCRMHDLIHDLATSNSKSETLILKAGSKGNIAHVRHLNLVNDMETLPTNFEEVAGKLHTLFSEGDILCKLPQCFKRLRILSLDCQCSFRRHRIEQLPAWIGEMKHLRFLDISGTRIKELPEFIMKLYNLQTLRFEHCDLIEKRPEGLGNLVHLKHICFSDEKCAPVGIGGLADLQTLPFFVVGRQEGSRIEELGSLSQLRGRLKISCLEFVDKNIEAKKAKLCEKTGLHELVLKWGSRNRGECRHDEVVLEALQPPSNVQSLTIDNYGGEKCPSWVENCSFSGLFSLKVKYCMKLKSIPTMRGFSALKELCISGCRNLISIPEDLMNLHSLIELRISYCENLRCIPEESLGCLVRLQKLRIGGFSEELEEFPGLSSIHCLDASLRSLTLIGWKTLKYLPPQIQRLTSLEELFIFDFNQVEALPDWLENLLSLQILFIKGCNNLRYPPDSAEAMERVSELPFLQIDGCPGLAERFAKKRGPKLSLFKMKALEGELERPQRKLAMIRDFLFDADEIQVRKQAGRLWLEKLLEVFREAEDVLDEVDYISLGWNAKIGWNAEIGYQMMKKARVELQKELIQALNDAQQAKRDIQRLLQEEEARHQELRLRGVFVPKARLVQSEQGAPNHEDFIEGDLAVKRKRALELLPQSSQQASKRCKHDEDWTKP